MERVTLSENPSIIRDYFALLGYSIQSYMTQQSLDQGLAEKSREEAQTHFTRFFQLLFSHKSQERSHKSPVDQVLCGFLFCLNSLVATCSYLKESALMVIPKTECSLLDFLFHACLFDSASYPRCITSISRNSVFSLLQTLTRSFEPARTLLLSKLLDYTRSYVFPDDWSYDPDQQQRAETGYVGLVNLGCICYMNATMQQLFLNPSVRKGVLEVRINDDSSAVDEKAETEHKDSYFLSLQEIFANLLRSECRAMDPTGFCTTYKNIDGSPVDITEQMDANEFLNILFDKIDNTLKGSPQAALLAETFGGKFSNQIICKTCGSTSEREEPFYTLAVNTKNKKSIEEGLASFVEGELLSGSNAYFCSKCNQKQTALKRTSVKTFPQSLIVALKRFEFNYDQMVKVKLNDYVEFPSVINMLPYSVEFLEAKDKGVSVDEAKLNPSEFEYELVGILVHSGIADAGHYYSYIRKLEEDGSRGAWLEFNDQVVSPFDFSRLADDCFGGTVVVEQFDRKSKKVVKKTVPRSNNAYMLFYEKKSPNGAKLNLHRSDSFIPEKVLSSVSENNIRLAKHRMIFDPTYFDFVWQLSHAAPVKFEDVCYSFVLVFSPCILRKILWIGNQWTRK
jgi:ubiquitin C-terminal hydrolase